MNYAPVVGRVLRKLKQVKFRSFYRRDHSTQSGHQVEKTDALAATGGREGEASNIAPHINAPPTTCPRLTRAGRGTERLLR
jgi:hypothetical protein